MPSPGPALLAPRHVLLLLFLSSTVLAYSALSALVTGAARAEDTNLELSFVPTRGVQMAVWVERADGQFMDTLALTYATATVGIGNRPGALQMNSGYRWPYGRREGVLPIWAHRRAAAVGARQFRRVIFQNRASEGAASRLVDDQSADEYYCLSFDQKKATRDALDAVTCASVFYSDKGRFLSEQDSERGYGEPFQDELGATEMRALSPTSLYPPRRDVVHCVGEEDCFDHADVDDFAANAREVMPELDAISRATPEAERRGSFSFTVPSAWSTADEYVLFIEVNTEGDYNGHFSPQRFPTPRGEDDLKWDFFSKNYGYPYRGQPSVLYRIPFKLDGDGLFTARTPAGYGALHGEDGDVRAIDEKISDDPLAAPGSGADRLHDVQGVRAQLRVTSGDVCEQPNPPPICGAQCSGKSGECEALACDLESGTCQSPCRTTEPAAAVDSLLISRHPNRQRAHMWARLSFRAPVSERPIASYEVKVRPVGGEWAMAFAPDSKQELLPVALDLCSDPAAPEQNRCLSMRAGSELKADLAGLRESTEYELSVTARDALCGQLGARATSTFTTAERSFSTVSPCFIASAAYGSPLAREVGSLRRLRDRYLATHAPGRALITGYYALGPELARVVREHGWLRTFVRALLTPLVAAAGWATTPAE